MDYLENVLFNSFIMAAPEYKLKISLLCYYFATTMPRHSTQTADLMSCDNLSIYFADIRFAFDGHHVSFFLIAS